MINKTVEMTIAAKREIPLENDSIRARKNVGVTASPLGRNA